MANYLLDNLFTRQTGENTGVVDPYSDRLDRVVASCPECQEANVVLESQQWSRQAAIQCGATIYDADEFDGDELPFDPSSIGGVQIAYAWDRKAECWDLAWVATLPAE